MDSFDSMTRDMGPMAELAAGWAVDIGAAILILIVGWIVAKWLKNLTARALKRIPNMDETLVPFLSSIVKYLVLIITLVAVLGRFGVQTASIIAVIGAAGLAIGLALQGTLQNIAAGVMLLLLRPFRTGEYVDCGVAAGTVLEIGLFSTDFKTPDGVHVVVPNSAIWTATIANYSRNPTRRMDVVVGIGYGDDIEAAMAALRALAEEDGRVLKDPAPETMVTALGASAVDVTLRIWTGTADFWPVRFDMTRKAKAAVEGAGCSIPFPQRDVHIVSGGQA